MDNKSSDTDENLPILPEASDISALDAARAAYPDASSVTVSITAGVTIISVDA